MKNRIPFLLLAMLIPFALASANDDYDFSITVKDDVTELDNSATIGFKILSNT